MHPRQGLAILGSRKSKTDDASRALGFGTYVGGEEIEFFPNNKSDAQGIYVGRDFSTYEPNPPYMERFSSLDPLKVKEALVNASICVPGPGCIKMRSVSPVTNVFRIIDGTKVMAPLLPSSARRKHTPVLTGCGREKRRNI